MKDEEGFADWLEATIEGAIRTATHEVARRTTAQTDRAARSKRFVACLGAELLATSRHRSPGMETLVRASYLDKSGIGEGTGGEFLWDIFIGRYGTAEDGSGAVLLKGFWAVESEFDGGYQADFNKLMVANVDHRLFILPAGTRQLAKFERQCRVASIPCWVAEVPALDDWPVDPAGPIHIKLQHFAPRP